MAVVNPESDLEDRLGDEELTAEELAQLELFRGLKKPPSFKKFPGSTVMRHYRKGDVICRQGDAGATAFYILTSEDVLQVKQRQLQKAREFREMAQQGEVKASNADQLESWLRELEVVVARYEKRVKGPSDSGSGVRSARQAATAYLVVDLAPKPSRGGFLQKLAGRLFGGGATPADRRPQFIPNDGPTDISYNSRQAPMYEGEVFGEMSCMTLQPRSATIVADADCYMIEFLRNIFDHIRNDAGYRERMDAVYRERVLSSHLRRLDILRDLSDLELNAIHQRAELLMEEPGKFICDEHDRADHVYIVRSGLVQVQSELNLTIGVDDIGDWQAFCNELLEGVTIEDPPPTDEEVAAT
jgi:CRP-like cAMP-binding protein